VAMGSKHGHAIEVNIDEDRIKIAPGVKHKGVATLDEYLVNMALESALNNAIRYAASKVDVWFEQDADRLSFFVLDDGPGPNSSETAHHPSSPAKTSSTGLGMSLCNAVTEAHGGGNVSLANAPDGGALFSLTLQLPA
jgi:signal transduction histidine kinase